MISRVQEGIKEGLKKAQEAAMKPTRPIRVGLRHIESLLFPSPRSMFKRTPTRSDGKHSGHHATSRADIQKQ